MDKQYTDPTGVYNCYTKPADTISIKDFERAKRALEKANVPGPYMVIQSPDPIPGCKQNCVGTPYREDNFSLGTLSETQTKETNMFHINELDTFNVPAPYARTKTVATSVGPISMALNMPPQADPAEKSKQHLLGRAGTALSDKDFELRKAFNLVPDDEPETIQDFFQRIKDGKITIDLTEKEQAERKFYSVERMLEEITWQDPARKADPDGFQKAHETLHQAYRDASDEIIVKAPEAGLEALRAFQSKTFN